MTTKIFTHAIIGTSSMDSTPVIRTGLWRLIPSFEGHKNQIFEESGFPNAGFPLPITMREFIHQAQNCPDLNDRHAADLTLTAYPTVYQTVAQHKCLCLLNATMLSVKWLDALKRDGHGIIMYDTEGTVEGTRYESDLYHFSTWENGQMKPRGTYSVQQNKWLEEPTPITSWDFRPPA